jgi:hypothetical protein
MRATLFILCVSAPLWLSSVSAADSVTLTTGVTLEGEIVRNDAGQPSVILATSTRQLAIARTEIKALERDDASRLELARRREKITDAEGVTIAKRDSGGSTPKGPAVAKARFELYEWARSQRLYAAAHDELLAAIAADPDHERARAALGHQRRDGVWLDPHAVPPAGTPLPDAPVAAPSRSQDRLAQYQKVAQLCAILAPDSNASEPDKQSAASFLSAERARNGEMLMACLNPRNQPAPSVRLGALKGIEAARPIGAQASYVLGAAAGNDPDAAVRSAAVKLIKARKDDLGVRTMIGHLLASYNDTGAVRDDVLHANALGALRELGDPRVCQALLQYVTAEIRATNVSAASMDTRQIDTYSANSGANVNVLVPLALPIQMPSLTMQQIKTTVRVPAVSALRDLSGQDFGEDWDKWDQWARKQK